MFTSLPSSLLAAGASAAAEPATASQSIGTPTLWALTIGAVIVLVIVESLSSYHSALLGGNGWTPELDRIAGHSRWFTNFHANGFTTDHGLIALFTGKAPLPSVGRYGGTRA